MQSGQQPAMFDHTQLTSTQPDLNALNAVTSMRQTSPRRSRMTRAFFLGKTLNRRNAPMPIIMCECAVVITGHFSFGGHARRWHSLRFCPTGIGTSCIVYSCICSDGPALFVYSFSMGGRTAKKTGLTVFDWLFPSTPRLSVYTQHVTA